MPEILRFWSPPIRIHYGYLCLLFLFSSLNLVGQSIPQFELITLEEGISNGFVTSMYEDDKGLIWLGTATGLNCYDGYAFRSFLPNADNPYSLSHPVIWALEGDDQDNLWIGTELGLNRFNLITERFTQFFHDPAQPSSISHNSVESLVMDTAGNMWIGTANGLNIWQKDAPGFERYLVNNGPGPGQMVKAIKRDRAGTMWIGSLDTLYRHTDKGIFIPVALPNVDGFKRDPNYIRSIYEDRYNNLWVGTEDNGVLVYNKESGQFRHHFLHQPSDPQSLSHNRVTAILEDWNGNYWVSTYGGGLNIINHKTLNIRRFNSDIPYTLDATAIRSMLKDKAGNIWLGSSYEGLYISKKFKKPFRSYTSENSGLMQSKGCSFAEAQNGNIWIGTQIGGLHLFDPNSEQFQNFQHQPDNQNSLASNYIQSLTVTSNGDLWIAYEGGKLSRYNHEIGRFYHLHPDKFGCGEWIKIIFADKHDNIWIGKMDGLCKYESETGQFIPIPLQSDPRYGNNRTIQHIFEDGKGNIWVSTNGGLNLYNAEKDRGNYYPTPFHVYAVKEDQNGILWVGTQHGLATFDQLTNDFIFLESTKDILSYAFNMFQDEKYAWWISSSTGLYYVNPKTQKTKLYNLKDGLINNQLLHGGIRTRSGEMYVSGISGFTRFKPEEIKENPYIPPVIITQFQLFNQNVPIRNSLEDSVGRESPLMTAISYASEITLKHWQNDFSFEFTALDYTAPKNNLYLYKLDGNDENWISTSSERRFAYYTNLSPGTYSFNIKASNNDGVWNEEGTAIKLVILSPWWTSWWAICLYAIMVIGILAAIRQFELSRRIAYAEARKQEELNQLQTRLYTNITHEFRTPLTIILGMADLLKNQRGTSETEDLKMITRNGKQLLKLVNQMLDLSKLESGHLTLNMEQGDIIGYLEYIVHSFHSLAESKAITLHFSSEQESIFMDYDADRLMHVLSNLLSNAIKFSPEESEVYVYATILGDSKHLQISVKDFGVGIPAEKLPFIFGRFYQVDAGITRSGEGTGIGLTLTQELVKLMGGRIQVSSVLNQGSIFYVDLPISRQYEIKNILPAVKDFWPIPFSENSIQADLISKETSTKNLILVVEDNADLIRFLISTFQGTYQIEVAFNGQEGIEKALKLVPDIIITDIMMPEIDGFELCNAVKNHELTSHIPIIMLTAKADVASRLVGLTRGADAYMAKPFLQEELQIRVRALLDQRKKLQEYYHSQAILLEKYDHEPPLSKESVLLENQFLQKVNKKIEENLDDHTFGVDKLSDSMAFSQSGLFRKIKALTGKNTNEYIRSYRIAKAKPLLQHTDMTIAEVAYAAGFSDPSYFSKAFKKETGLPPKKFRHS